MTISGEAKSCVFELTVGQRDRARLTSAGQIDELNLVALHAGQLTAVRAQCHSTFAARKARCIEIRDLQSHGFAPTRCVPNSDGITNRHELFPVRTERNVVDAQRSHERSLRSG